MERQDGSADSRVASEYGKKIHPAPRWWTIGTRHKRRDERAGSSGGGGGLVAGRAVGGRGGAGPLSVLVEATDEPAPRRGLRPPGPRSRGPGPHGAEAQRLEPHSGGGRGLPPVLLNMLN